jgi:hypothetical protein
MTSNLDVERVAKVLGRTASSPPPSRLQYQPFLFDCSCGATIEMTGTKETCWNCGETVEVRRCVETPHGQKYILRTSKHRQHGKREPLLWPLGLPPAATTHQTWHHHESPDCSKQFHNTLPTWHHHEPADFNKRCLVIGLLILLAPFYLPLIFALLIHAPETVGQSNARIIETAQPTDCGFFSGCHYERHVSHGNDKQGEYILVTWERVND